MPGGAVRTRGPRDPRPPGRGQAPGLPLPHRPSLMFEGVIPAPQARRPVGPGGLCPNSQRGKLRRRPGGLGGSEKNRGQLLSRWSLQPELRLVRPQEPPSSGSAPRTPPPPFCSSAGTCEPSCPTPAAPQRGLTPQRSMYWGAGRVRPKPETRPHPQP